MRLLSLALFSSCAALQLTPAVHVARRASTPVMGFFDGLKDKFSPTTKPTAVGGDLVTPFDRWLGNDKSAATEAVERGVTTTTYKDPNDVANYLTVSLAKPMGIAFVENPSKDKGLVVDEVLPTGSAASSTTPILSGDQLVAVDSTLVLGLDFDTGLDVSARHAHTLHSKRAASRGAAELSAGSHSETRDVRPRHFRHTPKHV